jgi:hypothetical protein
VPGVDGKNDARGENTSPLRAVGSASHERGAATTRDARNGSACCSVLKVRRARASFPEDTMEQRDMTRPRHGWQPACWLALAFVLALLPLAGAAQGIDEGRVSVHWTDPGGFAEAGPNAGMRPQQPEEWLVPLARHLAARAGRMLPERERLEVTITDVKRAGSVEPWRRPPLDEVRVVKRLYPPHITLSFVLRDAGGNVLREGTRELHDPAFLDRGTINRNDPLRYEKRLLDDWLRREFAADARAGDANG